MKILKTKGEKYIGKNKYNFNKQKFINDYDQLKSSRKMAKLYGCDKGVILKYAKSIGYINTKTGKLNDVQKQEIVSLYEQKTSSELADYYGVSRGQITKIWYDNNLIGKDTHKYPFDYNYFEHIDSNDKAYFLGLLASDGNVFKRKNSNTQAIIKLSLQKRDEDILEIFKTYLNSEQPLYTTRRESSYVNYICSLELVSDKMAKDLSKYNIVERKTYGYSFVELDEKLMSHFFRGYFDGDGTIFCKNNKYHQPSNYNIAIAGFIHNLLKMKEYLFENVNINSVISVEHREDKQNKYDLPFGNLIFTNLKDKYKFLNYIYKDREDIYLSRKRYLAECFINSMIKNYSNKQNLYNNILMPS